MKKYWALFAVILSSLLLVTACDSSKSQESATSETSVSTASKEKSQQEAEIILQEDGKQLSEKTVKFSEGAKLFDVLSKTYSVEASQDGFITAIDGHKQDADAQKFWLFTVNGKQAEKGAKDITLHAGDKVVFDLQVTK
ncbi:DUF4430 domain-containing protein [Enterococcus hirae]|jgi:hypothetical protein|nr:DUF4430 domain-containing protein [Enterococcaceae bacterium]MCI1919262.1 DUF4430 domain-containing protein [Enterococcaceae bacterium]MDM8213804.1 DUF4430 domain-containing protein [Enterococcus hirae]